MAFPSSSSSPFLYCPATRTGCYDLAEQSSSSFAVRRALSLNACDIAEPVSALATPPSTPKMQSIPRLLNPPPLIAFSTCDYPAYPATNDDDEDDFVFDDITNAHPVYGAAVRGEDTLSPDFHYDAALAPPQVTQSSLFGNLRSRWSPSTSSSIAPSPFTSSPSLSSQAYTGSSTGLASFNGRFAGPAPLLAPLRLDVMALDDVDSTHSCSPPATARCNAGLGFGLDVRAVCSEEADDTSPCMPSLVFSPAARTRPGLKQHSQASSTEGGSHIFSPFSSQGSSVDSSSPATPFDLGRLSPAKGFAAFKKPSPSNVGLGFLLPPFQLRAKASTPASSPLSRSPSPASSSTSSTNVKRTAPVSRSLRKRKASFFRGHSPNPEGTSSEAEEVHIAKTPSRPSKSAKAHHLTPIDCSEANKENRHQQPRLRRKQGNRKLRIKPSPALEQMGRFTRDAIQEAVSGTNKDHFYDLQAVERSFAQL